MQKIKLYLPGEHCPRCDFRLMADELEVDEVFCLSGHRYLSPHRQKQVFRMRLEPRSPVAAEPPVTRPAQATPVAVAPSRRSQVRRAVIEPTLDSDERDRGCMLAQELLAAF
jgi:hypothetical protein